MRTTILTATLLIALATPTFAQETSQVTMTRHHSSKRRAAARGAANIGRPRWAGRASGVAQA